MAYRVKVECIGAAKKKLVRPYASSQVKLVEHESSYDFYGEEDSITLTITGNMEEQFDVGKEYYVDFVKVIANTRREKDVEVPHGITPVENPNF